MGGCGMWLAAGHLREHFLCGHAGEEHEKDLPFQAGYVLATNAEAFGEDAGLQLGDLVGDLGMAYRYYCSKRSQQDRTLERTLRTLEMKRKYEEKNKATKKKIQKAVSNKKNGNTHKTGNWE